MGLTKSILVNLVRPGRYWSVIRAAGPSSRWTTTHLVVPGIIAAFVSFLASIALYGPWGSISPMGSVMIALLRSAAGFILLHLVTFLARAVLRRILDGWDYDAAYNLLSFSLLPTLIVVVVVPLIRDAGAWPNALVALGACYSVILLFFGIRQSAAARTTLAGALGITLLVALMPLLVFAAFFGLMFFVMLVL